MLSENDIENRFSYHPPANDQVVAAHQTIRQNCRRSTEVIDEVCPDGREKSLAITKLEEAMYWANAAIARANH